MAGTLNRFQGIGHLAEDVSPKLASNGNLMASGRIATNTYWYKDDEKMERTDWHNFVAFGRVADRLDKLQLKKGSQVYIEGSMRTRDWEDDNGVKHYRAECHLSDIQILSAKNGPREAVVASNDPDDIPYGVEEGEFRPSEVVSKGSNKDKWVKEYKKFADVHDVTPSPEAVEADRKKRESAQSGSDQEAPPESSPKSQSKYL